MKQSRGPDVHITEDKRAEQARKGALAWLEAAQRDSKAEEAIGPYLDAAAVLSTFKLATLAPTRAVKMPRADVTLELTERANPVESLKSDVWCLDETMRATALRRLKTRSAMKQARKANAGAPDDPVQRGIDWILRSNTTPSLDNLSLDDLLGVERAVRWFRGLLTPLPAPEDLTRRIERERHLAPMRKLAGKGFVDRKDERVRLVDYVGVIAPDTRWQGFARGLKNLRYKITDRPPLHLYGAGGMGKSALLARFILDHADPRASQPLPFVYLDFDRGVLNPREPQTLLEDAIRQLLIEFPSVDTELQSLTSEARENAGRFDAAEASKGTHQQGYEDLVRRFARLLAAIGERNDQPVLIVLDTLEEAEYQGLSAMQLTWNLLSDLLQRVDRLRIVTAGRSELAPGLAKEAVELTGLPAEEAVALIVERTTHVEGGPVSETDAHEIVALVGTIPLSVQLAVRVVLNEGMAALRDTVKRRGVFKRIRAEQQQGLFYARILNHAREHDADMEKLANPGLVLRRITPEIIETVLAKTCGIQLDKDRTAAGLFEKLTLETGLVDPYREPGAVWHQTPVRRVMLPELRLTLGDKADAIDVAAIEFYRGRSQLAERAEEIYHRLWRDFDTKELDTLWSDELETHLRGAYEELNPRGKIWLGDKLRIELSPDLRKQADYDVWERQVAQRARTLIAGGLVRQAIDSIHERERPNRPGPLFAIEADALKLLGHIEEAEAVVQQGLEVAERAGDRANMLALVSRDAFLHEGRDALTDALGRAWQALDLARELGDRLETLSAGVACLRLMRKIHDGKVDTAQKRLSPERRSQAELATLRKEMIELLRRETVRSALASRPALLQEAAAELGADAPEVLEAAIQVLGISPDDYVALIRYVEQRGDQLTDLQRELRALQAAQGTTRGLGTEVAKLVKTVPEFLVDRVRRAVEDSLRRTVSQASEKDRAVVGRLDRSELTELSTLVAEIFTEQELDLLSMDTLDIPLGKIAPSGPLPMRVHSMLEAAEGQHSLDRLLVRFARSAPDNTALSILVRRLYSARDHNVAL